MTLEELHGGIDDAEADVRDYLWDWLRYERINYADKKYAADGDSRRKLVEDMKEHGISNESEWWVFITNYLKRSQLLGIETEQGRQALGKTIITLMHCLETAITVHGDMPKPGMPSGEIEPWE